MSSPAPDQQQTLQFYKIQIMQKDREIADFTAKMKKIQFKHNRQLKQLKLGKERFEGLLKDQKAKADKFNKLAQENKEQNHILELRLAQLKREKERQISDIQSKYNTLKEEVRSYERILPTFTFLSEIGQTISELPNYQDLFVNLRQKTSEYNELQLSYHQAEQKWEEAIKTIKTSEQMLKNKKNQAQKHLKEIVSKLQENQYIVYDLKLQNQELLNKNVQLEQQLQFIQERCQSLQESVKEYEQKIEKLVQNFQNDLIMKEQQVYKAYQIQMIQLEEQLRNQQTLLERKQDMFNQQTRLLQQEMSYLNNKYQAEIQTFQQHYLCIKQETQRMKNEILQQKRRYDQLQDRFNDSQSTRIKNNIINEQTEQKNKALQQKIHIYQYQVAKHNHNKQLSQSNSFKQLQKQYDNLLEKINIINSQQSQLEQQRDHLQQQNFLLRQKISSKQFEHNESKSFLFDLSKAVQNFQGKMIKKPSQVQASIQKHEINNHNLNIGRDRRNSFYEDNTIVKDLQKQKNVLKEKITQIENKLKESQNQNKRLKDEAEIHKRQRQKIINQNITLKQKVVSLNKINNQYQKNVHGSSTKNSIQKTKIDSLGQELKLLNDENKRQKEIVKRLKEQIKALKETYSVEREQLNKEIKDITAQLQSLKIQRQELKSDLVNKQRLLIHESALLKNSRQFQDKLKQQIQELRLQKELVNQQILQNQTKQTKYQNEIYELHKEFQKMEGALKQSMKQNERTNQSLQRQRKQRSLLTVPSLHYINQSNQDEAFNKIYSTIPQKEGEINLLQRQISDLKQQLQTIRITHSAKLEAMQSQNNEYVQTIIQMKMRCAESQMRASQKQYLYMQLKKKISPNINLPKDKNITFLKP